MGVARLLRRARASGRALRAAVRRLGRGARHGPQARVRRRDGARARLVALSQRAGGARGAKGRAGGVASRDGQSARALGSSARTVHEMNASSRLRDARTPRAEGRPRNAPLTACAHCQNGQRGAGPTGTRSRRRPRRTVEGRCCGRWRRREPGTGSGGVQCVGGSAGEAASAVRRRGRPKCQATRRGTPAQSLWIASLTLCSSSRSSEPRIARRSSRRV